MRVTLGGYLLVKMVQQPAIQTQVRTMFARISEYEVSVGAEEKAAGGLLVR